MRYPTLEQVNQASPEQLLRWYRFLPSPGTSGINGPREAFNKTMLAEAKIMDAVSVKLKEMGGITPALSKRVGWDG